MTDKIVAFSTCGSAEEAARVARHLVERRVAACVNVIGGVTSVYHWRGAIEQSGEWLLIIKSTRALCDQLHLELRRVHSYEVPELIALSVVDGLPQYLAWMDAELAAKEHS